MLRGLVVFAVLSISAPLVAGAASAQLGVGVTVTRSSSINVRPVEASAPQWHITCATGACESLRVVASSSQSDLQIVTINF